MKTKVLIKCIMFIFTTGSFQLLNAQLPAAEYQPGIAILTGDIRNFQPEQNLDIRFAPSNLIMGRSEPTFVQPDSTGHFRQVVQLKYTTQIRVKIGEDYLFLLMSPDGQEYHLGIITLTEIILHWIIVFSFALGLRGEAIGPTFNNACIKIKEETTIEPYETVTKSGKIIVVIRNRKSVEIKHIK